MRRLLATAACFIALGCLNVLHDVETPGERPVVFGRIVAVVDGRRLSHFDFWKGEAFRLMILPDDSQTAFTYTPDEDGSFCWELPPGGYTFTAWSRGIGNNLTNGLRDGERVSTWSTFGYFDLVPIPIPSLGPTFTFLSGANRLFTFSTP